MNATLKVFCIMHLPFIYLKEREGICVWCCTLALLLLQQKVESTTPTAPHWRSLNDHQMATKALIKEAIAMTEKKINMSLDDIIKMSKKNAAKGKRPPRPPTKFFEGFQNRNPSHGNAVLQGFMDSRSSIRQGVFANRRSNFHGNQFPSITEAARKAAAISVQNRMINQNGRRVLAPTLQSSANAGSNSRVTSYDLLFPNVKFSCFAKQRLRRINPGASVQPVGRPFGSRQQQRRGGRGSRGGVQLVQRPFGSRQQQGRGGRGPRGDVQLGQRRFGSGQQQGRGGPRGGAHGELPAGPVLRLVTELDEDNFIVVARPF
ncbi:uncharacterized protein LOC141830225 [Curcuma longa]|uniref:uncharacterized protein LOC141830225 n=1 Tax=Curcuma longa TaxID=136217 RepID=UPI003D9EB900